MNSSIGRVTAQLAEPPQKVSQTLVELINKNVGPPKPVCQDDVYVRVMFVASDEVNSLGGRFPVDEHERLAELLVDSPVMVGHRKDKLPIARTFHAKAVVRNGRNWVKSYFYWLKTADGAEDLRENIDGGIYKECSVGFTFLFAECSLCGKDIRECRHEPLATYQIEDKTVRCHYNYRDIERVLETSLVYRGAVPDTLISGELVQLDAPPEIADDDEPLLIRDLSRLDSRKNYLVVPFYEAVPVIARRNGKRLEITRESGEPIPPDITRRFCAEGLPRAVSLPAYLVGFHDKVRLRVTDLEDYLAKRESPVSRLELMVVPKNGRALPFVRNGRRQDKVRCIHCRIAALETVDRVARKMMTTAGVRLWPLDEPILASRGYRYRPPDVFDDHEGCYSLALVGSDAPPALRNNGILSFSDGAETYRFVIGYLNLPRLMQGRRFLADKTYGSRHDAPPPAATVQEGPLHDLSINDDVHVLALSGILEGTFTFTPVKIGRRHRYLFSKVPPQPQTRRTR